MGGDWIILPVRPLEDGKRRLAGVLSPAERRALNARFFDHVLSVACAVIGPARCLVVTSAADVRALAAARGAISVKETGAGLNSALAQGAEELRRRGAVRALALSCDLPFLTAADIAALFADLAAVVLAPDTAGVGTNALLTRVADGFPYAFGLDSRAAHRTAAARRRLSYAEVRRPGLSRDIDVPADLASLAPDRGDRPPEEPSNRCDP